MDSFSAFRKCLGRKERDLTAAPATVGGAAVRSVLSISRTIARIWKEALEAASRLNSSECTPGLDRPLCNYRFFLFNIYLTTLESLT